MKHLNTLVALALGLSIVFLPGNYAESVDFTVSAFIEEATGVSIVATENQIVGGNEVFGDPVTEFDFNPMTLDPVNQIYVSDHFFAVDVAATGGAGAPDVTVAFLNESNPAGQATGLGSKATATFTKVTGGPAPEDQDETPITNPIGPTVLLGALAGGQNIDETVILGGFLRIRVGIFDGANQDLLDAGGEPFTNGDQPGNYTGTFRVTASVD